MKYFIASDIHGSAYYCEKMLSAYDAEQADRIILLGDILYHGPRNDLPKEYAPKAVVQMLSERSGEVINVRGNCDCDVDQMLMPFPMMADYMFIPLGNRTVFATHGHLFNLDKLPPLKKGDILLHGHTHIPAAERVGSIYYLNPGSVSIPKGGYTNSYMTLQDGLFIIKSLDGDIIKTMQFEC